MLEIRNLVKHFGPLVAVDGVSFTVPRGEVLGFLGPNGAGKSTTMKMITGFVAPTSGTAIVCGHDITAEPIAAKAHIGYLPEGAPAYPDMTPRAFLGFIARIRGLSGAVASERIDEIIEMINLEGVLEQPIETLSKGYKRRVGVAQALLHDPDVLILDEPTDGLDPNQKHEMRRIIAQMQPQKAIIISTHLLEEVEAVCNRAIIIAHGRILADATPAALAERSRFHNAVRVDVAVETAPQIQAELAGLPGVAAVEPVYDGEAAAFLAFPKGAEAPLAEIADLVQARGWPVLGLRVERGRLDDVFRDITTRPPEAAAA
jgi:ABC-2 type transport system ATP-binding protein